MKNIVFSFVFIVLAAVSAKAQTSEQTQTLRTHSQANYLKNERIHLEKETELKILEKLEESRLQEEKTRMRRIEAANFNVLSSAPQTAAQTQTF